MSIQSVSNQNQADTIYSLSIINKRVVLKIINIGNNITQTLEKVIAAQIEGNCIVEGFVKPASVRVISYSSGIIKGSDILFEVVFECLVCSPVEGMIIRCIAKNITKAGIKCEINELPSPMIIFVARDHHFKSETFSNVKENDLILVKVIGQRYELNDKYVSVIAELMSKTFALPPAPQPPAPQPQPQSESERESALPTPQPQSGTMTIRPKRKVSGVSGK